LKTINVNKLEFGKPEYLVIKIQDTMGCDNPILSVKKGENAKRE